MNSQELRLDHFKIYDVANQQAGHVIGVYGQFDEQPERIQLTMLNAFANPVSKNGEEIYDKNAHLNYYDVYDPVPEPTRVVKYENQFGTQKVYIGRTIAFLAPAQKYEKGSEFPKRLDHFKVYQVLQGEPPNKVVTLEDQFEKNEAQVSYPFGFAVPVRKYFNGEVNEIQNEKAHLVLYRISPSSVEETRMVRDQFARNYIQVFRSVLLAVPSEKLGWEKA